jgi:hypothetical protein
MSNLTRKELKLRVSKLTDNELIYVLDCKKQLEKGIKENPLAKWRLILIDTLVFKIINGEIDEIELLILEQSKLYFCNKINN